MEESLPISHISQFIDTIFLLVLPSYHSIFQPNLSTMISGSCNKLFSRVGSIIKVRETIDELSIRLSTDKNLQFLFDDVSSGIVKLHSIKLLNIALSGFPEDMDLPDYMIKTHKRLFQEKGLSEVHFDLFLKHLIQVFNSVGWPTELIDEAVHNIVPLRDAFSQGAGLYGSNNNDVMRRFY
jgi:truncated hemoglobin YjbI